MRRRHGRIRRTGTRRVEQILLVRGWSEGRGGLKEGQVKIDKDGLSGGRGFGVAVRMFSGGYDIRYLLSRYISLKEIGAGGAIEVHCYSLLRCVCRQVLSCLV